MSTTVLVSIPQTRGLIFFNLAGENHLTGLLGFLISSFYFFNAVDFNHSEIVNLKSGVHFSRGDFRRFTVNVAQCVLVNLAFYVAALLFSWKARRVLSWFGVTGEFLEVASFFIPVYAVIIGTLSMLTNLLRGTPNRRRHDQSPAAG